MLPDYAETAITLISALSNSAIAIVTYLALSRAPHFIEQIRGSVVQTNRMRNVEEFEEAANHLVQFVSAKRLYMGFACRPIGDPYSLPGTVALSGVYADIQKQREELNRLQSRLKLLSMRIKGDAPPAAEAIVEIFSEIEGAALATSEGDVPLDDAWLDRLAYKPGDQYSEMLTRSLQIAASLYDKEFGEAR